MYAEARRGRPRIRDEATSDDLKTRVSTLEGAVLAYQNEHEKIERDPVHLGALRHHMFNLVSRENRK